MDEGHHTARGDQPCARVCHRASTMDASGLQQLSCVVTYARGGGSSGALVSDGGVSEAAEATRTIWRDAPETTTCCTATAPEPQGTIVGQLMGAEDDLQGEEDGDAGTSAAAVR